MRKFERKFEGTPGPYVVAYDHPDEKTRETLAFIRPESANSYAHESIADIYCCGGYPDREANARLFAASWDLLMVLMELTELEGPLPGNREWHARAIAAIDKALGGGS